MYLVNLAFLTNPGYEQALVHSLVLGQPCASGTLVMDNVRDLDYEADTPAKVAEIVATALVYARRRTAVTVTVHGYPE